MVDVLSKYAWAIPIKNKTGAVMVQALQMLWKQASPRQPQRVQSDDGTEFMNAKVQAFFKQHQVDHFSTQGDTKDALAEVLIKTLKTKLHRYFTAANTLTCLKALPTIVKQYNHTVHSSIQEKPVHVTPDNEYVSKRVFAWLDRRSIFSPGDFNHPHRCHLHPHRMEWNTYKRHVL